MLEYGGIYVIPSSSMILMIVVLLPNATSGSEVVSATMKVWFPSNASSFKREIFTHLTELFMEPEVKTSSEKILM